MANDLINYTYVLEPPIKKQKEGDQRASQLVNMWRFGESSIAGKGIEAPCPFPILCSMHFFHLDVPELYSFLVNR